MCLMVIILQLNIVCLAQEDFLLNANEENNLMSNSKFSSGNCLNLDYLPIIRIKTLSNQHLNLININSQVMLIQCPEPDSQPQ